MLYLLKGSRVIEYRRENLAILEAPEGRQVSISYSRRWVADGLRLAAGTAGVIVFSDSPYESFVPVRFCQVLDVAESDARVVLTVRLGPYVRPGAAGLLTDRWAVWDGPERPGLRFLVEDDNPGLGQPSSVEEYDEAWRVAVDGLRSLGYFERSSIARIVRVADTAGVTLDPAEPVEAGTELDVHLEVRTPLHAIAAVEPVLDVEPRGAAELVEGAPIAATGEGSVRVRLLAAGPVRLRVGFKPEPLESSRPAMTVTVVESTAVGGRVVASPRSAAPIDPEALLHHLRRDAHLSASAWLHLHEDVLLRGDPDNPDLLGDYAEHASAAGEHAKACGALESIAERTPEQNSLLLLSALRSGRDVDFAPLLRESDFSSDRVFPAVVAAIAASPPATVHELLRLLMEDVLSDDKLITIAEQVRASVTSVDVLCDLAERIAYLDPDAGVRLLLDRWSEPATMPARPLELVVDWEPRSARTAAYQRERLGRVAEAGDLDELSSLAADITVASGRSEQAELLALAGRYLLDGDDAHRDHGYALLVESTERAAEAGAFGLALDNVEILTFTAWGDPQRRAEVDELKKRVDAAVDTSDDLRRWEQYQTEGAYQRLRPRFKGHTLHLCGGRRQDWADELCAGLDLAELRWHETEKHGSKQTGWVKHLGERDVVVVVTSNIGHAVSSPVKAQCKKQRVPFYFGSRRLRETLSALEAGPV